MQEYQLGANPNRSDTDNDGMSDTDEERYQLDITHNDRSDDADGDGVSNYNEIIAGTNPSDHLTTPGVNSVLTVVRLLQLN